MAISTPKVDYTFIYEENGKDANQENLYSFGDNKFHFDRKPDNKFVLFFVDCDDKIIPIPTNFALMSRTVSTKKTMTPVVPNDNIFDITCTIPYYELKYGKEPILIIENPKIVQLTRCNIGTTIKKAGPKKKKTGDEPSKDVTKKAVSNKKTSDDSKDLSKKRPIENDDKKEKTNKKPKVD